MTVLLVWTTGLPHRQGVQLLIYHLVSTVNVLSANLDLKNTDLVNIKKGALCF